MTRLRAFVPNLGEILPVRSVTFDFRGLVCEVDVEHRTPVSPAPALKMEVLNFPASAVRLLRGTEHKDKIGIEIFEGDILYSTNGHDSRPETREDWKVVFWKGLSWRTGTFKACSCGCGKDVLWSVVAVANLKNLHKGEIVGNIYTHPELRNNCRASVDRIMNPSRVVVMMEGHE